jgi:hypothetical protein
LCRHLVDTGFDGQAVIEINTQNARTQRERSSMLGQALAFAREHLEPGRAASGSPRGHSGGDHDGA